MKINYSVATLTAVALSFSGSAAWAQQPGAAAEQRYLSVISVKVPPAKEAAFTEHYKTGAGAKAMRARLQAYPKLQRWSLLRAVYAGDPAQEANYLIASVTTGAPEEQEPAKRDEITKSATGMNYAGYMEHVRTMSDTVGTTLSHIHQTTPGYALAEGDYVVLRRLKTTPGRQQAMNELYRDIRLPLVSERVAAGAMKGWSYSHLSFPTGTGLPYDATEATIYKDLASAVGGGGGGTGSTAAARFAKQFPDKNYTSYTDTLREGSTIVRMDLYRVVAVYTK